MELILQLHGGSSRKSSSAETIKTSAPGSTAVAGIDGMAEGERANLREQLSSRKGRKFTDKTGGVIESMKKALLGE